MFFYKFFINLHFKRHEGCTCDMWIDEKISWIWRQLSSLQSITCRGHTMEFQSRTEIHGFILNIHTNPESSLELSVAFSLRLKPPTPEHSKTKWGVQWAFYCFGLVACDCLKCCRVSCSYGIQRRKTLCGHLLQIWLQQTVSGFAAEEITHNTCCSVPPPPPET